MVGQPITIAGLFQMENVMPKATVKDVRASLIRAGVISPEKKVEVIRGANKPSKPISRLNAILARRNMTSHA